VQWSFRKTGRMGTLASQREIGVWVQAPEEVLAPAAMLGWVWEFFYFYMQNPAI